LTHLALLCKKDISQYKIIESNEYIIISIQVTLLSHDHSKKKLQCIVPMYPWWDIFLGLELVFSSIEKTLENT